MAYLKKHKYGNWLECEYMEAMSFLYNNRHKLTLEDEETIKRIANKINVS